MTNKPLPTKEELHAFRKRIATMEPVETKVGDLAHAFKSLTGIRQQVFNPYDIANQPIVKTKLGVDRMDQLVEQTAHNAEQWISLFGVENFAFNSINKISVIDDDTLVISKGYRFGNSPEHEKHTRQFYGAEVRVVHLIDVESGLSRFAGLQLTYGDLDATYTDVYMDTKFYRLMKLAVPHYKVHRTYSENIVPLGKCAIHIRTVNHTNKFYQLLNEFVIKHIGEALIIEGFNYFDHKSVFNK